MTGRVFISYRRRLGGGVAGRLRDRLERRLPGMVFMDVAGLTGGEAFAAALDRAVAASRVAIAVIDPDWRAEDRDAPLGDEADFVTRELSAAEAAGLVVIPVLIDGAGPEILNELPEGLSWLALRHAETLRAASFDRDYEAVEAAVFTGLGLAPPTRLERLLESLPLSFGMVYSLGVRNWCAAGTLVFALFALVFAAAHWALGAPMDPEVLMIFLGLGFLWLIGRNAARRRWMAHLGIGLGALALLAVMAAPGNYALPARAAGPGVQTRAEHPFFLWIENGVVSGGGEDGVITDRITEDAATAKGFE